MRYQERIYIQNSNEAVRNRDILNVNMSSDICIFEPPMFNLSGASKIDCTGNTGTTYVISSATTIPLTFQFTANTNAFSATNATFKYEIYKYNNDAGLFFIPPVYKSDILQYSGFSGTNSTTQSVPVSGLSMDGEYLVKGYFDFNVCTEYLSKLGKKVDTLLNMYGTEYGIYDSSVDYFFRAIRNADTPIFAQNVSNIPLSNTLYQQVILPPAGEINLTIASPNDGFYVLTLNGLVLAKDLDYTVSGNVITLSAQTVYDDIITIIYTTGSGNNIVGDNINILSPVVSGTSNNQGVNTSYFNTTTGKFEIYTNITPVESNTILVMINGATLANGIDYYQSSSNPKRIILEGDLMIGDIITIIYFPITNVVNGLITNTPVVSWAIANPPQLVNGIFSLEVSSASTFNTLYSSGSTSYVIGQTTYSNSFIASGNVGTTLYYRVKNEKNYATLCGDIVSSTAYSETIPIVIQTNSINSY